LGESIIGNLDSLISSIIDVAIAAQNTIIAYVLKC